MPGRRTALSRSSSAIYSISQAGSQTGWWFQFTRAQMTSEELIDDGECIGGLERDRVVPPFGEKQSTVHTFRFPAQDFKMRVGDKPRVRRAGSAARGRDLFPGREGRAAFN